MGLLDEIKKLTRPYTEDEDVFSEYMPAEKKRSRDSAPVSFEDKRSKVVNIHTTTQLQVVLTKPERYENVTDIADHLKEKRTVVLNLESANREVARRILDFLCGVAYALDGKIKKVAERTYIVTPFNVDIMGDLIDELESTGVYF
ncbi:MAG: cell division protein SepF [Clostridiales bacterium]|jgi:cell division inhibitor SepF|nr:cell division protein SepF [Clostridiales bacterium]